MARDTAYLAAGSVVINQERGDSGAEGHGELRYGG